MPKKGSPASKPGTVVTRLSAAARSGLNRTSGVARRLPAASKSRVFGPARAERFRGVEPGVRDVDRRHRHRAGRGGGVGVDRVRRRVELRCARGVVVVLDPLDESGRGAGEAHDLDAGRHRGAQVRERGDRSREPGADVVAGIRRQDRAAWVRDPQVDVGGHPAQRLVPVQRDLDEAVGGYRRTEARAGVDTGPGVEVVQAAGVAIGALVALAGAVAGGGEVGDAGGLGAVDGLGDGAILEGRLAEIEDVIGDHVDPGGDQGVDRRGLADRAGGGAAREHDPVQPRRLVVDDLRHRPTLIDRVDGVVGEHDDVRIGGQVAACLRCVDAATDLVDRVGDHADVDPGAAGAEQADRLRDVVGRDARGGDRADVGAASHHGHDRLGESEGGAVGERVEGHPALEHAQRLGRGRLYRHARGFEPPGGAVEVAGDVDVDQRPAALDRDPGVAGGGDLGGVGGAQRIELAAELARVGCRMRGCRGRGEHRRSRDRNQSSPCPRPCPTSASPFVRRAEATAAGRR